MEAVAYVRGIGHTDRPACVSPALGAFGRRLNDILPDDRRQELKPFIPLLPGTAGDGKDAARGYLAADWAVRTLLPMLLDHFNLADESTVLRNLGRVRDQASARSARGAAREARTKLYAAVVAADAAGYAAVVGLRERIYQSAIDVFKQMINPEEEGI